MFGFHCLLTILARFWDSLVIVAAAHFGFWGVPGIRIISPRGKPTKWHWTWPSPRHFPYLACFPLFLPYSLHCHPKLSRKYRERRVVPWTLVVLASTLQKKGWQHCPNCMMPQTTAFAFPAKGFQANTDKLGMAFGRARPGIGRFRLFRDVSRCFKL